MTSSIRQGRSAPEPKSCSAKAPAKCTPVPTHGVLSGPALERLNNSVFTKVVVTDTIPSGERLDVCSKLQVVSVASLLAKSIHNIHTGSSVSVLF